MNKFKAIVVNQEGENFTKNLQEIDLSFLKEDEVTVKVDYSSLNYKDGMILKSTACLFVAKKKAANLQPFLNF